MINPAVARKRRKATVVRDNPILRLVDFRFICFLKAMLEIVGTNYDELVKKITIRN